MEILFLGSGLFQISHFKDPKRPVDVGLGTDVGGGTSFSLLATMGAAYEIAQLNGRALSAVEAFYLATLGGARALRRSKTRSGRSPRAAKPI